jgi:eukaryotic-like serine/threonine-protein kinase
VAALIPSGEFDDIGYRRTLAFKLSEGPLPLARALSYAAQLAGHLRDEHAAGRVHGFVSTGTVLIGGDGAELAPSLSFPGEHPAQRDIQGWGTVLQEMLAGAAVPAGDARKGPDAVLSAATSLARKCLARAPERMLTMQQAYNEIRLLAVLARQYQLERPAPAAEPVPVPVPPAALGPVLVPKPVSQASPMAQLCRWFGKRLPDASNTSPVKP